MNTEEQENDIIERIKLIYDRYIMPIITIRSSKLLNLISCKNQLKIDRGVLEQNKILLAESLNNIGIPYTIELINITAMILTVFNLSLQIEKKNTQDDKISMTVEYDNNVIELLVLYLNLYYKIRELQRKKMLDTDVCIKIKENYKEIICSNEELDMSNNGWNHLKELVENIYFPPEKSFWQKKYLKYKKKYLFYQKKY